VQGCRGAGLRQGRLGQLVLVDRVPPPTPNRVFTAVFGAFWATRWTTDFPYCMYMILQELVQGPFVLHRGHTPPLRSSLT
jgi:hypothetical protein